MYIRIVVCTVTLLSQTGLTLAGSNNVFLGKRLCSQDKQICVKGSMDYNYSEGVLEFHGRIKKTTKPGTLTIRMKGTSKNGETFYTSISTSLQGKYSELIKSESHPYYGPGRQRDVDWGIDSITCISPDLI